MLMTNWLSVFQRRLMANRLNRTRRRHERPNSACVIEKLEDRTLLSAPVAVDDFLRVEHDTTLSGGAPGVLGNDADWENDPLTASLVTGVANGTLTLNANGSYTYTPNANFVGSDSFTYQVQDATETGNTATVNITVVNDAGRPIDDSYAVTVDTTLTVNQADGLLDNDWDFEGDSLTAALDTGPTNGTLTLNSDGSLS